MAYNRPSNGIDMNFDNASIKEQLKECLQRSSRLDDYEIESSFHQESIVEWPPELPEMKINDFLSESKATPFNGDS